MDAKGALADLVEISPRIEAALLFEPGGSVLGAVGVPAAREVSLVVAVSELVQAATESGGGTQRVTQLRASLGENDVFVVGGASGERGIVALANGRPAPGLVFHDLKRCLAALDDGRSQEGGEAGDA